MDNRKYEAMVSRLEDAARRSPRQYLVGVVGITLLGFLILGVVVGFSLLGLLLVVALVAGVILSGGKALLLAAKLGKLVALLALPAWVMLKSSVKILFSRFPPPQGRELRRDEAPALFVRLDELRQDLQGPRIHTVLLVDELNAAIVQHPRFGLFGWEKNYLILGLPLLQVLTEEEALAVVAHEYGHLSGHHGRLGGFVYRLRSTWGQLQQISEQWNDWGSRLVARLFRWYAPYFNAYTFVLARQNEYEADRSAVEVAGAQNAANALMRINIASLFEAEEFWPAIDRRAVKEPEPIASPSAFWRESVHGALDEAMRARFLEQANRYETNHADTHPALRDRLAAIGVAAKPEMAQALRPVEDSAADLWLGSNLDALRSEFDDAWRSGVVEDWHSRHAYLRQRYEQLADFETRSDLDPAEQWEYISVLDELRPATDLMPMLDRLLEQEPGHLGARFRRGALRLHRDDESGIAELEVVMQQDEDAILPGCEAAWRFYAERDPAKAEEYLARWQARSDHLEQVQAELQALPADATLAPAELDQKTLDAIRDILKKNGRFIRKVYLMRRMLESDARLYDHVLAFETSRLTLGLGASAVIKRLVKQEFPLELFVVHLGSSPYKKFRKYIRRQKLAPLEFR